MNLIFSRLWWWFAFIIWSPTISGRFIIWRIEMWPLNEKRMNSRGKACESSGQIWLSRLLCDDNDNDNDSNFHMCQDMTHESHIPLWLSELVSGNKQSEQCFVADWECWVMAAIYRAMKSVTTSGKTDISKQREDNINKRFCGALHFLILSPWIQGRAVCQKPSHRKCTQLPTCR